MREFATTDDLVARFRIMDAAELDRAEQLLIDASNMLDMTLAKRGITIDSTDESQANELCRITCDMVARTFVDAANDVAWGGAEPIAKYKGLRLYESDLKMVCPRSRVKVFGM